MFLYVVFFKCVHASYFVLVIFRLLFPVFVFILYLCSPRSHPPHPNFPLSAGRFLIFIFSFYFCCALFIVLLHSVGISFESHPFPYKRYSGLGFFHSTQKQSPVCLVSWHRCPFVLPAQLSWISLFCVISTPPQYLYSMPPAYLGECVLSVRIKTRLLLSDMELFLCIFQVPGSRLSLCITWANSLQIFPFESRSLL